VKAKRRIRTKREMEQKYKGREKIKNYKSPMAFIGKLLPI
jgi:hypothetical protein